MSLETVSYSDKTRRKKNPANYKLTEELKKHDNITSASRSIILYPFDNTVVKSVPH